jgi:hypothetical protein
LPITKASTKQKYNTKTAKINKIKTKQTHKKTILQEKICKSTGAKSLYSEETQISLF